MRKWFKVWFVPFIVAGIILGTLATTYTPKFKTMAPPTKIDRTVEERIADKAIELRLAPKNDLIMNGSIGAVIGWIISKFLDAGLLMIKKRIVK